LAGGQGQDLFFDGDDGILKGLRSGEILLA
jgi:hypothetical protein